MKNLKELTLKEHTDLKRSGLMWIIFPDATGDFREDCKFELATAQKLQEAE